MFETRLLRFHGGGVPPGFLNADPILDQKMLFPHPKSVHFALKSCRPGTFLSATLTYGIVVCLCLDSSSSLSMR